MSDAPKPELVVTTFTHWCPVHNVMVDESGNCGACGSREALVKLEEPVVSCGVQFIATV